MNLAIKQKTNQPENRRLKKVSIMALAFALVALLLSVSTQSLWIDEASSAMMAMSPGMGSWLHNLAISRTSDAQMPLYMFWLWLWVKVFGHSEWMLRLAGWPWLAAGLVVFGWRRPWAALACGLSAFAWYYANEARPYAMQLGASLAVMGVILNFLEKRVAEEQWVKWCGVLAVSAFVLAAGHLLGMIWAGAYLLIYFVVVTPFRSPSSLRRTSWIWGGLLAAMAITTAYYLWTLKSGARATEVASTNFATTGFCAYELLGLGGLGPGRLELRMDGLSTLRPFLPLLVPFALITFAVLIAGVFAATKRLGAKFVSFVVVIMIATALFILGVGVVKHFRVLGRHLTPLLPLILWLLAEGASDLWRRWRHAGPILVVGLGIFSLASCLEYRFAARHAKDDYRDAARVTRDALGRGEVAWWNAARKGAEYYGVPLVTDDAMPSASADKAWLVISPGAKEAKTLPPPDVIIASKSDIFDSHGDVAKYIRTHDFVKRQSFQAFQVWQRRSKF
jgi:hypothetical protein